VLVSGEAVSIEGEGFGDEASLGSLPNAGADNISSTTKYFIKLILKR
jgi:hypothetical protein